MATDAALDELATLLSELPADLGDTDTGRTLASQIVGKLSGIVTAAEAMLADPSDRGRAIEEEICPVGPIEIVPALSWTLTTGGPHIELVRISGFGWIAVAVDSPVRIVAPLAPRVEIALDRVLDTETILDLLSQETPVR